jgi:hypothetical protein
MAVFSKPGKYMELQKTDFSQKLANAFIKCMQQTTKGRLDVNVGTLDHAIT